MEEGTRNDVDAVLNVVQDHGFAANSILTILVKNTFYTFSKLIIAIKILLMYVSNVRGEGK